ncbi:MAG: hypothetical protein HYU85_06765 [Chloroflexi bacterium]|nr:hypothetical protein [Chloroflexota bacterium]
MKKKVIWLVLSGGMVLTLLLSACAPAVVEKEKEAAPKEVVTPKEEVVPKEVVVPKEEERFVKWTGTKADGTVVERMVEKPKYGGTLVGYRETDFRETDFQTWDQWSRGSHISAALHPTHDRLVTVDFTRTMVGTGEYGLVSYDPPYGITVGRLAESWEIPDDTTKIWHIRQGVHWRSGWWAVEK